MTLSRRHLAARILCLTVSLPFTTVACRTNLDASEYARLDAGHALCPVCKAMGDLACQTVTIRADTPISQYRGATYYFCSVQCKKDFDRQPVAYLGL